MTACRRSASPPAHAKPAAASTLMQSCTFQVLLERDQLPVKHFEEEILSTIDSSPVVLVRGATGCGKTTQVPQFILDRFIKGGRASDCNIVVTQVAPPPGQTDPRSRLEAVASLPAVVCSPGGSAPSPWPSAWPTREGRSRAKAAATASALSPSFHAPTPASSSAPWVSGSASVST